VSGFIITGERKLVECKVGVRLGAKKIKAETCWDERQRNLISLRSIYTYSGFGHHAYVLRF